MKSLHLMALFMMWTPHTTRLTMNCWQRLKRTITAYRYLQRWDRKAVTCQIQYSNLLSIGWEGLRKELSIQWKPL